MKKRRSAGEIASILNEYRTSGPTQAAFAESRCFRYQLLLIMR